MVSMWLGCALAACGGSNASVTPTWAASASAPATTSAGIASGGTGAAVPVAADPLSFSASNYSVAQDAGLVYLTIIRVGSPASAVSVDYLTMDGTAMTGTDYSATSGTLQWEENDSSPRTIVVPLNAVAPYAGAKTFTVALSNPSAAAQIAAPDRAVVTITGSAGTAVGNVQFSDPAYAVDQATQGLMVTVNRTNGLAGSTSVQFSTTDATALAGIDYAATSGTLDWSAGDGGSKTFVIPILGVLPYSGEKSFGITLSEPTAGATLGFPGVAMVTIAGAASPSPGTFELSAPSYAVAQNAGTLSVTVTRTGGSSGQASIGYATSGGTAVQGNDFTAASGVLTWADGDSAPQTIAIGVSAATPFSGNRVFSVGLFDPLGGATIGNPGMASITIAGSATPALGSVQFSLSHYFVAQGSGLFSAGVERIGGSSGAVSVQYSTQDGSALAGADYSAASGVLQWADGDAAPKVLNIPVSTAALFSGTRSFSILLSNPGGGTTVGNPGSASVTIEGGAVPAAAALQLSLSSYVVAQGSGLFSASVERTGDSSGAVSVHYSTEDGTALAGVDYAATSGLLQWADGDASPKVFNIPVSTAVPFSGTKSFSVVLSNPTGGANIDTPGTAPVVIMGAASTAAGSLHFSLSTYSVAQGSEFFSASVERTGGSVGSISATYATQNGSAVAGVDYSAERGVLQWVDGDSSPKVFNIPVSNAAPFTGTKSFNVVLSNATGGAVLGMSSDSAVNIVGDAAPAQGAGPSAPTGLLMTGQGRNSISLAWNPATPGSNPIAHYNIYRNGAAYAVSTADSYDDASALNATNGTYTSAATIYSYAVSAVDTQGNEGPKATQTAFDVYYGGVFNWGGDYSYSAHANYQDTSGVPESGADDIAVTVTGPYGGFQPYAGNTVPQWDLEAGSFGYLTMDLKPTMGGQDWRLSAISRLPPGDVYPWASVDLLNYGPAPMPGIWATYKVPLSALSIGSTQFQGSISGTTLTVTSVDSGVGVDAGGFISGSGVTPGTYIVGYGALGGAGTYTVYPSQNVASTAMTEQRTAIYKVDISDQTGASSNLFYVDNLRFTSR
jgi:hypothetical protein